MIGNGVSCCTCTWLDCNSHDTLEAGIEVVVNFCMFHNINQSLACPNQTCFFYFKRHGFQASKV